MSIQQATDAVKVSILEYKFAIFMFCLFSFNALCAALVIALTNVTWSTLDGQGKFMIYVAVGLNWSNTVMAFCSTQAKRIKRTGEIFPVGDDTQQITKDQVK